MVTELQLSKPQFKILNIRKPRALIMAGQRAGKSFGIGFRSGLYVKYFPKMVGMIAANTYKQLEQSTLVECRQVWKKYLNYTEFTKENPEGVYVVGKKPPAHFLQFKQFKEYDGIISFANGAIIFTASLDNYIVHDGKTLGWCELDETKDTKEEAVKQVILARLSQSGLYVTDEDELIFHEDDLNKGDVVFINDQMYVIERAINPCVINTSPAEGVVEWIITMFKLAQYEEQIINDIYDPKKFYYHETDTQAVCIFSTFWNERNLSKNYIQDRLTDLTQGEIDKFIYGYPFAKTGGEYFEYFDRRVHVKPTEYLPFLPVHLTYDFNLLPYMTLVCIQILEDFEKMELRIFKEYCYKPPRNTTEDVTSQFYMDHFEDVKDVYYYGDAMGTRGVEGFGNAFTRFNPVREVLRPITTQWSDRTMRKNLGVNKRRNLINKILAGKLRVGERLVQISIDPDCTEVIRDFQYLKQGKDGKLKEMYEDPATKAKWEKLGHTSDAIEYMICNILESYL